jgi:hypothetical protein
MFRYAAAVSLITVLPLLVHAEEGLPARPEALTSFSFAGHAEDAATLDAYVWRHFYKRLGNGPVLFNKEYLTTADLWLHEARERGSDRLIQNVHRANLSKMEMDAEGYVLTHQHFSHAHDHGWPFPMWTQSGRTPEEREGLTAGWHFQPVDQVPGWVGNAMRGWQDPRWVGETAAASWTLEHAASEGIQNNRWVVKATGASPVLTSPEGIHIEAFQAPFLQMRWKRNGTAPGHGTPYVEWMRDEDEGFSPERRVYLYPQETPLSKDFWHSISAMHRHPQWEGTIKQLRFSLAPGESDVTLEIDSIFTVYDTRHTINNPIFVMASYNYFGWTGDLTYLRENINRMRRALQYQMDFMGARELGHIRNTWPGHDGLPGYEVHEDGSKTMHPGHGIGNNYWDLLPFGWDDFYATYQYYAAVLRMADLEEAIAANPGWDMPRGVGMIPAAELRAHADKVKTTANEKFWNSETGRFVPSINKRGEWVDDGLTFVNLDAIWYGVASEDHAASIMDWIAGARTVAGDTSTGDDIYRWRFGPRATTKRNVTWYGHGWTSPESIPWGGQVQDGGAVLGFSFYDLWARLQVLGPDNAWARLQELLAWDREVQAAGGYRAYYADGKQGTTLQGGGTAGGLGIDFEFYESSLIPAIVPYGFLGLWPAPEALRIDPALPAACPELTVHNLRYRGTALDVTATENAVTVVVHEQPLLSMVLVFADPHRLNEDVEAGTRFTITDAGTYVFQR